jgi:hypothetical protein
VRRLELTDTQFGRIEFLVRSMKTIELSRAEAAAKTPDRQAHRHRAEMFQELLDVLNKAETF